MTLQPCLAQRDAAPLAAGKLLDEPTNHLDAESVEWLENHLARYAGAVLAVTHDRYFLDNVAEWIAEVDRGESYLDGKWQAALNDDGVSAETKTLIRDCHTSVRSGHDQMSALKHGMESNA